MDQEQALPNVVAKKIRSDFRPAMLAWSRTTWLRYWGPTLLWVVVVALFSSKNASALTTGGVLAKALELFDIKLSAIGMYEIHMLIRKAAHFITYMVLSFLAFRSFRGPKHERRHRWDYRWAVLALAVAFLVAAADEGHQTFTPGRTGSAKDVALDMTGALFAQLFIVSWTAGSANGRRRFLTLE